MTNSPEPDHNHRQDDEHEDPVLSQEELAKLKQLLPEIMDRVPGLIGDMQLSDLQPDVFPSDRILAEFIESRDSSTDASGGQRT